jgi:hypothetical protein
MSKNLTEAIKDSRAGNILGELISWNLYNVEIPQDKFKEIYQNLELPKECYHSKRTRTALTKALRVMEGDGLIRKASESDARVVYVLVEERRSQDGEDITFNKKNTVIYDKASKSIRFKQVNAEKEAMLKELFERYQNLITGREISKTFVKLARHYGISVSEGGGIYFIPVSCLPVVDKMLQLIKDTRGTILRLGVSDREQDKEDVRKIVQKELLGELKGFNKEARQLKAKKLEGDGTLRGGLASRRINKLKMFTKRVGYFDKLEVDPETEISTQAKKCLKRIKKLES